MRISDWSSDVCSSDLKPQPQGTDWRSSFFYAAPSLPPLRCVLHSSAAQLCPQRVRQVFPVLEESGIVRPHVSGPFFGKVEHHIFLDPPRSGAHQQNAAAEKDRFLDAVGDQHERLARPFLQPEHFLLHNLTRQEIECAEGLVCRMTSGSGASARARSEERRVGKECSTCRSRWSPSH